MNDGSKNLIVFPRSSTKVSRQSAPQLKPISRWKQLDLRSAGAVIAVALLSFVANHQAFHADKVHSLNQSSRSLASVDSSGLVLSFERDSDWEKSLSEKLAKAKSRQLASIGIGRPASLEDQLRWGVLDEKYTILFSEQTRSVQEITHQDKESPPTYLLDRVKFFQDFGPLFVQGFSGAELKSSQTSQEQGRVESYMIFNKEKQVSAEAQIELDKHSRLLSIHVIQR